MNRRKSMVRMIGLASVLLLSIACGPGQLAATSVPPTTTPEPPTATPSPVPPTATPVPSVTGVLTPWGEGIPIAGRRVVLCRIVGDRQELPADCVVQEGAVSSGEDGSFQLDGVLPGAYYVLYDSGRGDFDDALERWGGQTFSWDESEWQVELFGVEESDEGWVLTLMPQGYQVDDDVEFLLSYFPATLLLGDSPFIMAHDIRQVVEERVLELAVVDVREGGGSSIEFPVLKFREGSFSGLEIRLFE